MNAHSHDPKIKAAFDVLERRLDQLMEQNSDDERFWKSFAAEADPFTAGADAHDVAYARRRIDCMLKNAGVIPGEDEGEPCN